MKVIQLCISRDGKKLHLFGHLLRNKIAEIIAKIARKVEKFNGVLDNQNFYSNLMFLSRCFHEKKCEKNFFFK